MPSMHVAYLCIVMPDAATGGKKLEKKHILKRKRTLRFTLKKHMLKILSVRS